ncbi:MAG: hypothetical protein JSU72_15140 [Deltaproteobacteria bacterium]|nr:MAG: hypothetical protein JSU72_15140 [Deltaproteobacteria bacterium]
MNRILLIVLILQAISQSSSMIAKKSQPDALAALPDALPNRVGAWTAEATDRIYDEETIFSYIDGAGEVYKAYNMRNCLSRRYITPNGPTIVLDIFDMGSSEDAFGVFTHDQDGKPLDVGQGALYRPGWLSFWKGRFFVSIYGEEETAATKEAIGELAKVVASLIKDHGLKPEILLNLPSRGLLPHSVRFLHHYVVLNYHFYLSDTNILNLGPETDAVLAMYERGDERAHLLVVTYPDSEEASAAHRSLLRHYLPEADSNGVVLLEDGKWSAAAFKNKLLTVVLEADSRPLAEDLLREVMKTL